MADTAPPSAPSKTIVFVRRTASTLSLWALVTAIFMSRSSWAYLGLIAVLTIIATLEYFSMLKAAKISCFPKFGILLTVAYCAVLHGFLAHGLEPPAGLDEFAIFLAVAGAFLLQLGRPLRGLEAIMNVALNSLGFVYIAFLFNFLTRIVFGVPGWDANPGTVSESGAYLVLWVLAVTKFTDMGAYITGSMIGKHKMIAHVSPGKTWEGFGGALFFSQIAGCGLYLLFPQNLAVFGHLGHVIALGFLLAMLAVVGDLAESVIKRALEAKDSGRMLPGIGGSMDLIDSVCFTAPATYFYLNWILLPVA